MATSEERTLMAQLAGTNVAFWRMDSGLWSLFNKAIDQGYSPDRLLAEAKNTRWYKNHAESVRRAQALKKQDPKEYARRVAKAKSAVQTLAAQVGIPLKNTNFSKWGKLAFVNDWDAAELRRILFSKNQGSIKRAIERSLNTGALGGEMAQAASALRNYMYDNGLKWSNKRLAAWLQDVAAGTSSVEKIQSKMQKEAVSMFPGLKDEILGGTSVRDFADSYIRTYAELLEVDPDQVNVWDNDIKSALNTKDKNGKFSPLSIADFENRVRQSKKWLKTQNAQDSMMEAGHAVLQAFGVTW